MLHGRVVRPRGQRAYGVGAKVASLDETSIRGIAGARVLRRGDFVGVVAENEWDAVRAARQLKVTWEPTSALPGSEKVYERMRAAKTTEEIVVERGNVAIRVDVGRARGDAGRRALPIRRTRRSAPTAPSPT